MHIDHQKNEIVFKIVYYGPGLSGKTTNLEYVHSQLDPGLCGDLISLKTSEGRTLFFDFLHLELGRIQGKKPRFHLYTTAGQARYAASRQVVLQGTDSLVFVVDSQRGRLADNFASLKELQNRLTQNGVAITQLPWLIQYNKRDLPMAEDVAVLERKLNIWEVPYIEAIAVTGRGVFLTLRKAIELIIKK
ncbi:gliding-motility protein MglA [candidate division KSB1 bacterium]|nr:gliding-motility protein MglA [candidate division KSB1 bacterium]